MWFVPPPPCALHSSKRRHPSVGSSPTAHRTPRREDRANCQRPRASPRRETTCPTGRRDVAPPRAVVERASAPLVNPRLRLASSRHAISFSDRLVLQLLCERGRKQRLALLVHRVEV